MLNALDLFSGIAGNTLGLREYTRTIAYCEADRHAQSVLLSRMSDGSIDRAPICTDIQQLDGSNFNGLIDIIVGGFPCQDISVAGKGKGLAGERSGLFFEVCRLVKEIEPSFVFLENVPAIRTRGLREVVREFTDMGYDCRWTCVSAAEVGAPHLRKRWFLLAYRKRIELWEQPGWSCRPKRESATVTRDDGEEELVANTSSEGLERQWEEPCGTESKHKNISYSCRWSTKPNVGRVANGVSLRVDRIKRLGNAVVPLQAKVAFKRLMGIEK
jgi:DNA (cytosine-5)-methyltransferase 1